LQRLQFLTWLEADGLAWGNRHLRTGARITSDPGFPRTDVEDAEAPQFDPFALCESPLHALENGLHRHFRLGLSDPSAVDYFIDDVEFDQSHPPHRRYLDITSVGRNRDSNRLRPKLNDKIGVIELSRMPVSRDSFRRACSRFATGVAIATVLDESGEPHGLTINSFTPVSAEPPIVLICIDRDCSTLEHFKSSRWFALSFLSEAQQELSNRFAVLPEGRFQGVAWHGADEAGGMPVLDGAIGWMSCRILNRIEAGDHWILLGEVEQAETGEGQPLLYFNSGYQRLA
jgi:flavin reductase (DIM6/NTAB) family NADH-FMN oxidoreductase RutF